MLLKSKFVFLLQLQRLFKLAHLANKIKICKICVVKARITRNENDAVTSTKIYSFNTK